MVQIGQPCPVSRPISSDLTTFILSNNLLGRFLFFMSTNVSPYHRIHHQSSPQARHTGFALMLSRLPELEHIHQASQAATSPSQEIALKDLFRRGTHTHVNR